MAITLGPGEPVIRSGEGTPDIWPDIEDAGEEGGSEIVSGARLCAASLIAGESYSSAPVWVGVLGPDSRGETKASIRACERGRVKFLFPLPNQSAGGTCRSMTTQLKSIGSGAICLAHCDGSDTENEVASVIEAVKSLLNSAEGRLELHIVGGFNDKRQLSQNLSQQLLRAFDNQAEEIHLVTFCVTDLNDKKDDGVHLPIIYGIAVNVKTGEIFKARFEDHQPDEDLRLAYILAGGNMVNIYDAKSEQLNIGPYSWTPFPNIDFWLEQEDEQILQCFSTSPEAEPPHFVRDMRSALLLLKEHPYPCISLFPHGQPRSYKKENDGQWQKI
ncbi:PREDICTED: protein N-terminal asparagine amidohydrolase [Nanorana parkeri]|uniref:protein N-terminal asparagine amidohydrolase n=1 Tax=Nanorana parkeri TaxID=125878 RepID=UPI000853F70F|nr:PREDICTED: protein N-terminal asparagine amidohydrolase [Nanorana parkeri]